MQALVAEIERKEGKRFSKLLATSTSAVWHDPAFVPQNQEERDWASAPLVLLDMDRVQQLGLTSRLTGAIFTFLRSYQDQDMLNRHMAHPTSTSAEASVPSKEVRLSLVGTFEKGLGFGDITRWKEKLGVLDRGCVGDPTLWSLYYTGMDLSWWDSCESSLAEGVHI